MGTAVGTKFAPAFANIFMGHLEESFVQTCLYKSRVWWRFLDDIFMRWLHGGEKLMNFWGPWTHVMKLSSLRGKFVKVKYHFLMLWLM